MRVASGASQIEGLIRELRLSSQDGEALCGGRAEAELLKRPGEERWCAAECIEHLNLSNRAYLPRIEEALGELRQKRLTGGGPFRLEWNARLLKYWLEPPSRLRLPTGAAFQPVEVKDAAATFAEFSDLNRKLEGQLESAGGLNLGGVKIVSPFAENVKYSAYSAFVLIAAHNRRHLWQAERALNEISRV